ncbi:ribonuclease HI family protein [candidate division WOR-3 bacterium]|nr:ribonuclease HI family protein [candidate division WOR-3 bacterium]
MSLEKREPVSGHLFTDAGKAAQVWIDGASSGNPGPAGAGAVIKKDGKLIGQWKKYLGETTNNVAEYQSLILALEKSLELGIKAILVYTDSELLHRQISGAYKVRTPHLRPLFEKVQELKNKLDFFRIRHIPREQNAEADRLARQARTRNTRNTPSHNTQSSAT